MSDGQGTARRILARVWNLAWDLCVAAAIVSAVAVIDLVAVHKGAWWVAVTSALAFLALEIGVRIAWHVLPRLVGRGRRY